MSERINAATRPCHTLQALTAAAMLLPGLPTIPAHASDDPNTFSLQYGRYVEGDRSPTQNAPNRFAPLHVDSLRGAAQFVLHTNDTLQLNLAQDTWSGATPITTAPTSLSGNRPIQTGAAGKLVVVGASPMINGRVQLNRQYQPIGSDSVVHTLSSASPETRRQVDMKLSRRLTNGTISVGTGMSHERDYTATFINFARRWNVNNDLTNLTTAFSYTRSETQAVLDHDAAPYITKTAYLDQVETVAGLQTLKGARNDWTASLGWVQVLGPTSLLESNLSFSRAAGYLGNPYKVMTVLFADPAALAGGAVQLSSDAQALLEQRPSQRRQWSLGTRLIQHISPLDASLRLGMRRFTDDWGIAANSYDLQWTQPLDGGWTVTPRLRYYTQDAASFYSSYLVSQQAFRKLTVSPDGDFTIVPFDAAKLPAFFSNDQRLAGFGSTNIGISVSKQLARGITLEAGVDYTRQSGSLKSGNGKAGSFADLSYQVANFAVKFDLDASRQITDSSVQARVPADVVGDTHPHSHHAGSALPPAGVMFAHPLVGAGEWMLGYRAMTVLDRGPMRNGHSQLNDVQTVTLGCAPQLCYSRPMEMRMHMHMLDVMIGLTDGVNLMLMPQYVDMGMQTRLLDGAPSVPSGTTTHTGTHETGGIGDTSAHIIMALKVGATESVLLSVGLSAPTGDSGIVLRRTHQLEAGYAHYGMQLSSGTWDLMAGMTYLRKAGAWALGGQVNTTQRLQSNNKQGFALGDAWQATAWFQRPLNGWLTASFRGSYTYQESIHGKHETPGLATSPADLPANNGGGHLDMGVGVAAHIQSGALRGSSVALEWMKPLRTVPNGVQLPRDSTFNLRWMVAF
jgi:hypothetical protein